MKITPLYAIHLAHSMESNKLTAIFSAIVSPTVALGSLQKVIYIYVYIYIYIYIYILYVYYMYIIYIHY